MNELTIAIIDRSQLVRDGLRQNLSSQQDFRLIDCDPDKEPLKFIDANAVDVVLRVENMVLPRLLIGRRPF